MSTDVTLRGRLTRDPELKFSQAGKAVARFSVVTSRRGVAFGQLAENCSESPEKGTAVVVTGHASQEEWTTKEGDKRKSIKVVAEDVAPSLRWASAKVAKAGRQSADGPRTAVQDENPFANDEPPF